MTTPPTILSEQEIEKIKHRVMNELLAETQGVIGGPDVVVIEFPHRFANALLAEAVATLAQGVELEPIARVFYEWPDTGPKLGWNSHAAMNAAILDESRQEVKLVPLSTAQAAVAAERVKYVTPAGWQLVMVPKDFGPEPDYDDCAAQATEATGLKMPDRAWLSIFQREVRRWMATQQPDRPSMPDRAPRLEKCLFCNGTGIDGEQCSDGYHGGGQCHDCNGSGFKPKRATPSPAPAAEPAPKQWPFVESPGAFTKRLRDALFDLDQDLLAAVRNVLIENPPQLATISPLPAAADAGLAHELWSAAQLAPGEGVEDGVRRIAALLPAAAGVEDRAGLVEECKRLREGLRFYAAAGHFHGDPDDLDEFDSVSGEPESWLCHSENSLMVENGGVARLYLRGKRANWVDGDDDDTPTPIEGEVSVLDRLASAPAQVPEGWQLVPKVPTQEMCQQGQWKAKEWPKFPLRISPIYQAMLAAAPAAPMAAQVPEWDSNPEGVVDGEESGPRMDPNTGVWEEPETPGELCAACDGTGRVDSPNECLRCGMRGCQTDECAACNGTGEVAAAPAAGGV